MGLHLARFLPSKPPGSEIQRLNALAHEEPYSTIFYGVVWTLILFVLAPIAGVGVLILTAAKLCWWAYEQKHPNTNPIVASSDARQLAVVITGCDSGFGRDVASKLVEQGFVVFCGCLLEESFHHFKDMPNAIPLQIDVTNDSQVQDASKIVHDWLHDAEATKKQQRCLHALFNNAGMGKIGYVDWLEISDYQICMDVNCFGMIRMVKAFLPIFKSQFIEQTYTSPQIINMISMAGMVSGGGMALTAYEAAKHAIEAFTDGLRLEMKMFGISVVAVNPSFHSTPLVDDIGGRIKRELWPKLSEEKRLEYGEDFFDTHAKHVETVMTATRWDVSVVVDQVMKVIQSRYPPAQVLIGTDSKTTIIGMRLIPQWVRNLIVLHLIIPNQRPAMLKRKKSFNATASKEKAT